MRSSDSLCSDSAMSMTRNVPLVRRPLSRFMMLGRQEAAREMKLLWQLLGKPVFNLLSVTEALPVVHDVDLGA